MNARVRADVHSALQEGHDLLCCPDCRVPLTDGQGRLHCAGCDESWPVQEGVIRFGGADPRRHPLTLAQRDAVASAAATYGWQTALHDVLRSIDRLAYRLAVDEYRAQWRFLLPITPSSSVLDLNCGWGAAALNLAECCAQVVAADACPVQARFLALRAYQTGRENLIPIQIGLGEPLPFATNRFDAVVLVDTLSWVGQGLQRKILSGIREVLRPGGSVFVADTNRLGVLRRRGRERSHMMGGYLRLLRDAGFRETRVYGLAPSHLMPFFMVPMKERPPHDYFMRELLAAQLQPAGNGAARMAYLILSLMLHWVPAEAMAVLARPFWPSFGIVAR